MKERMLGKRIIILGNSGSGKSTLAKQLHDITGLPLFHLDLIWWNPDMTHIARDEFDAELAEILKGDSWIIDGDYSRTYQPRFEACDTVIFLDYGVDQSIAGITGRVGQERDDIPWVEEILDPELVEAVLKYEEAKRPRVYEFIGKYADKQILIFKTREETQKWLEKYRQKGMGNIMKHAVVTNPDNKEVKTVEAKLTKDRSIYLAEAEYTDEELEQFENEKDKWIVRCAGSQCFLADSDSGEDATGYYRNYFDLVPQNAVFDNGKLVGFYLLSEGFTYSGRGRYNFSIDSWDYPGGDPFKDNRWSRETHVFLFDDKETHEWGDWDLLVRDPQKEYKEYLNF